MQALVVGMIAVIAGVVLGYWLGRTSTKGEQRILEERISGLEVERSAQFKTLETLQSTVARLNGELGAAQAGLQAEISKYKQMKSDIEIAFGDLAAKALTANTQNFLTLAKQELSGQARDSKQALEAREAAIKNLVDPLQQSLSKLDIQTREMEKAREGAYGKVETLIQTMQSTIPVSLDALRNETSQLITALRAPKTRGNWGELQLRRCVEYAGMVQYCSFTEQVASRDEEDVLRIPDMIIHLPNGREIVVDAKTPLDAFLNSAGDVDPASQRARFEAHAQRVRAHLKNLSNKSYWKQFERTPDFVVCFLPSEALFSAALEVDPSLIEFSSRSNVVLATPTTLIALLRAVEFGWQQMEITKNAKEIHELGRRLYDKFVTLHGHVSKLGSALSNSVDNYNKLIGSIEGKQGGSILYLGRQIGELVHSDNEIPELRKLQPEVREFESPEWSQLLLVNESGEQSDKGPQTEEGLALAAEAESGDGEPMF